MVGPSTLEVCDFDDAVIRGRATFRLRAQIYGLEGS